MQRLGTKQHRRNALSAAGKLLLTAVPVLGLAWGILTYFLGNHASHEGDLAKHEDSIAVSYVRLETNAILDLLAGDTKAIAPGGVHFRPSGLAGELSVAFSPEAVARAGRTINAATFLSVTNRGKFQIQDVRVDGAKDDGDYGALAPGDTLLVCVRLEKVDGSVRLSPLSRLQFRLTGGSLPRDIGMIPRPDQMNVIAGAPGIRSFYPPSTTK